MKEITIQSWSQFVSIAEKLDTGKVLEIPYAFRGHADSSWELAPSLIRDVDRDKHSVQGILEVEQNALTEFKSQAHLFIEPNEFTLTKDLVSWWTIMQHHGAPTRLLDWTSSIFVAAYFAAVENFEKDGAIWLAQVGALSQKMNEKYSESTMPAWDKEIRAKFLSPEAKPILIFFTRSSRSKRMVAQQGIFSVSHNILASHGEILDSVLEQDGEKELYRKLIIPASLKLEFLKKLKAMNVSANSLFPGLDGLGKSIREIVHLATK